MTVANTTTLLDITGLATVLDTESGAARALDGIDLQIARGETYALLGESGSGKSMTALSIMRLLPDAARIAGGRVGLDGQDLLGLAETAMRDVRGRRIAMVFQEPALSLNPVMTVGDQIAEALARHTPLRGNTLQARVVELMTETGIADAARRSSDYPFQFSGGMKQRVMIAIALACGPELLIADEPTTALDVTTQAQILDLLRRLQREHGMALLLITHDLAVVSDMAQKVGVMYAGEIVETAPRGRFFERPAHPYSRKLFESLPTAARRGEHLAVIRGTVPPLTTAFTGCRFADRCDHAWARCRREAPPWYPLTGGQAVRCHLYDPVELEATHIRAPAEPRVEASRVEPSSGAPLLEVKDLSVHFAVHGGLMRRVVERVKAVDGVSFSIAAGRTLALVGESGSGKTTVGRALLRLIEPAAGRILFENEDWTQLPRRELRRRRNRMQIVFQDPYASLNPRMRVAEILDEGMAAQGVGGGASQRALRIESLLEEVGLSPAMKFRYPHEFSGGQRQRIAIARALSVEPALIVCDEPTSALDVSVQAQILNLLESLQRARGLSYLFITHNISVVEFLAHDIAVMRQGRIVEQGAAQQVLESPQHDYTRALLAAVPRVQLPTQP